MGSVTWPISGDRERELIDAVLSSGQWGGYHPFVGQFERDFAAFQHCRFGVSAVNGTVTIEMALEALGIGDGDEVIVPAISFVSTATAVSRMRATPVFVDIDGETFNVDPERIQEAITSKTKAIIVVHFGGPMADMDSIVAIAAEHGLPLIEDAAHSHGSEWNGVRAGSIGVAGSFSFQNSKVITAGEGGMLVSNDEAFTDRVREIQDQGRKPGEGWFFHYSLGTNYRITAFQAAVLIAQLERLPEQNCRRERSARIIRNEAADIPGLYFQKVPREARVQTNYLLLGRVSAAEFGTTRDEFHHRFTAQGFPCTPFYPHTLYSNPLYSARTNCRVLPCPNAEARVLDSFWVPHRALLGCDEDAHRLAAAMRNARAC